MLLKLMGTNLHPSLESALIHVPNEEKHKAEGANALEGSRLNCLGQKEKIPAKGIKHGF